MKKLLLVFYFLFFITVSIHAELIIKKNPLNLGTLYEGTIQSNVFILSNNSSEPFPITSVKPTCGCTFAKPETNLIPPFATTKLHFTFNSMYFSGDYTKTILLFSNKNRYYLIFKVTVKPIFQLSQKIIKLGQIDPKEVIDYNSFIKLNFGKITNISVENLIFNKRTMKVIVSTNKRLNRFDIRTILTPYFYSGPFSEPVSVFLKGPNWRRSKRVMFFFRGVVKK